MLFLQRKVTKNKLPRWLNFIKSHLGIGQLENKFNICLLPPSTPSVTDENVKSQMKAHDILKLKNWCVNDFLFTKKLQNVVTEII